MTITDKPRLNAEQKEAAEHINGPMLVLAGPGSGKTFLLVERIINLIEYGINPENILVITFSKKAAMEMEWRFQKRCGDEKYHVNFGTFHAVFFHILTFHGVYNKDSILDIKSKYKYIENAGRILGISKRSEISWKNDMLEKISYYKNVGEKLFIEPSFAMDEEDIIQFKRIFECYSNICKKEKKLDFDDMVFECQKFLSSSPMALSRWQNQFRYILVDEFQDINNTQYQILKLLCRDNNIFAVGDDAQSIYGFRGASPGIMQTYLEEYNPCRMVNLKLNYRSCYEVVKASDTLIRHNKNRIEREIQKTLKNRKKGTVRIDCFENEIEEAEFIISEVKKYKPSEVAIIFRSDHCITMLEELLRASEIQYNKKSTPINFYEIEVITIIISYLKIVANKAVQSDYLRIINHPDRGLSREFANDKLIDDANDFIDTLYEYHKNNNYGQKELENIIKLSDDIEMIGSLPLEAGLIYLFKRTGLLTELKNIYKKDRRYPKSFDEIIEEFRNRSGNFKTVYGFIDHVINIVSISEERVNNYVEKSVNSNENTITLISAHASKGLEYPVVFVAGLQEGLFPHHKNLDGNGIEEERRLMYVAMTRAKDTLYLCGRGTEHGKRLSRFIDETGIVIDKKTTS